MKLYKNDRGNKAMEGEGVVQFGLSGLTADRFPIKAFGKDATPTVVMSRSEPKARFEISFPHPQICSGIQTV